MTCKEHAPTKKTDSPHHRTAESQQPSTAQVRRLTTAPHPKVPTTSQKTHYPPLHLPTDLHPSPPTFRRQTTPQMLGVSESLIVDVTLEDGAYLAGKVVILGRSRSSIAPHHDHLALWSSHLISLHCINYLSLSKSHHRTSRQMRRHLINAPLPALHPSPRPIAPLTRTRRRCRLIRLTLLIRTTTPQLRRP